jgi:hypothetical protein
MAQEAKETQMTTVKYADPGKCIHGINLSRSCDQCGSNDEVQTARIADLEAALAWADRLYSCYALQAMPVKGVDAMSEGAGPWINRVRELLSQKAPPMKTPPDNTMSMVERVARAMCLAEGLDPDADWREGESVTLAVAIPDGEAQRWQTYVRQARAAITAMQRTDAERIVALLGELGIKRTEITTQHMAAVHSFLVDTVIKHERKP